MPPLSFTTTATSSLAQQLVQQLCWAMGIVTQDQKNQQLLEALDDLSTKEERINKCLSQDPVNLWELRELALSKGGLLNSTYRKAAWHKLVGLDEDAMPPSPKTTPRRSYPSSPQPQSSFGSSPTSVTNNSTFEDEKKSDHWDSSVDLIKRDVHRSVIFRYPPPSHHTTNNTIDTTSTSESLATMLQDSIRSRPSLYYYQGLHDIAGVLLHHLEYQAPKATPILQRIQQSHLRDALRENFGNITWLLSVLLMPLVKLTCPLVHYALVVQDVELSNVCLPWIITWFTHDVYSPETSGRLLDGFLAGHALLPLYFAVAVLTHPILKRSIVELAEEDYDPASMFAMLKELPKQIRSDLDTTTTEQEGRVCVQELLDDAISIMRRVPPRNLLDLVSPEVYSRTDLLQRASSISMFKAPSSWSMASGNLTTTTCEDTSTLHPEGQPHHPRSKLASGVPMLMATIETADSILGSPKWGSQRHVLKNKKKKRKGRKQRQYSLWESVSQWIVG